MLRLGEWIEKLFEEHKLVRRLLVFWALSLITFVILVTFNDLTLITASVAAVVSTIVGILSVVINFYVRSREVDDRKNDEEEV